MAFFKIRWPGSQEPDKQAPAGRSRKSAPAESVEAMRRRARHRLVGAAVLVLLGVVGFPLLFDTQPRPVAVDIPIEIPDRNKAAPLPAPVPAPAASAAAPAAPAPSVAGLDAGEEVVASTRPAQPHPAAAAAPAVVPPPAPAAVPPARTPPRPEPPKSAEISRHDTARHDPPARPEPKPESPRAEQVAKVDDAARARALLEGRTPAAAAPATAADGRFIVQVGAFGDDGKAREVRAKLERAGLKTYTQTVDTKDGKRIRVRVGPFAGKAEADKAAARIKGLDLPAAVLTL
ncbi:SPOR domain-containing protein [Xylophilus sp.]|uniref:SPOR domain-containing protein n=1 Tax=Xylophilus sp. TaxID=2653893 RepID=UPI0013B9E880|nr:SPOR domain-containing protein [Xylophilus sp.]KAF1049492.1 MAG: Cell division protein DedD [Xylophilus sp.]